MNGITDTEWSAEISAARSYFNAIQHNFLCKRLIFSNDIGNEVTEKSDRGSRHVFITVKDSNIRQILTEHYAS